VSKVLSHDRSPAICFPFSPSTLWQTSLSYSKPSQTNLTDCAWPSRGRYEWVAPNAQSTTSKCGRGHPPVDIVTARILCLRTTRPLESIGLVQRGIWRATCNLMGRRKRQRWATRSDFPSYSSGFEQQKALRQKLGAVGKEFVMANQETRKCAHIPCLCDVPRGVEYCSDSCRDAGSDDVEIACQCDHTACPLTARPYVPRIVADLAN
jgi:hypothetical protein